METPDQLPLASRVDDEDHDSAYALLRDGTSEDAAGADDTGRLVPLSKLFAFADTTDRVLMALGALGGVVAGASGPVQMVLLGDVLNAFNPAVGSSTAAIRDDINELALSFVIVGAAAFVGGFLEVACWSVAASRQARRLRGAYVGALLAQEIGWFDVHSPSQLAARAADAAVAIQDGMGSKVGDALRFLAMGVAGVAIGLVKGWQLTLLLLAFTPFVALATYASVRVVAKATRASLEAYGVAGAVALEALANVRTVHVLNAIDHFTAKYEAALNGATRAGVRQGLATGWGQGLQFFAIFCTYAVGLFFGAYKVGQDQLGSFDERCRGDGCYDGGRVITVFMCVVMGAMSLGSAGPCLRALYAARAAAVDVFDLIERQSHIDALAGDGITLPTVLGHVKLHDVTFAYPSRPDVSVCRHYSLAIRAGETIAFVGASGSGKSTVVALLQRFYDPQSGVVKLDGTDVREMNVHWLREQIGLVGQEPALFATTVMDNIRHGRPSATDEEVAEAARLADALSFIKALPKGFETEVGERGAQLSGGQKQRIAIARAVLKNPPVLLLDEATSALDAESEYAVQTALDKLCANTHRTTIVVAHRLSTVRSADRIAFHADGAVTELGSHDELMRIPGSQYRAMVELQQIRDDDQAVDERPAQPDSSRITHVVATDTNAGNNQQPATAVDDMEPEQTDTSLSELEAWNIPTRRIWRQALPEWRYMVVGGIGAVVSAAMYPIWAVLLTKLTVLYFRLDYSRHELLVHAGYWSLGFLGVAVVFGVCMTLQHFGFGVVAQRTVARVRAAAFSAMLRQEIAWFDRDENASGALAAQLASDAGVLQAVTTDTLNQRLVNATTLVLGLFVCFYYSWRLTLLIVATTPLFVFASYMELKQAKVGSNNKTGNDADAAAGALLAEAIGSIRTVVSFGLERTIAASYTALLSASSAVDTRTGLVTGASFGTSLCVLFFVISFLVWLGGRWFAEGTESFEDFMMVFTVVMFSALAVGMAAQSSTPMDKVHAATFRLFSVMDREPMIDSTTRDLALVDQSIRGDIHFNHVSFNYPSRPDTRVYNNYDLHISAGQTVALVGASGSGKSTAISLLERFYDPSAGSIMVDDSDIRQLNLPWLRDRMSLVSQEPVLFVGTIAENIAMGKPGATREEVVDAAKKANAFDFISNFPDGFDTDVGDRGAQVSGGQKQRIAIARAVISDPDILLLDEATSALDAESEHEVQASLDALLAARQCTTIVVAHRLSTVRNADVIAVADGGRVVELGTHAQLMAVDDGAYRSLVARQVEL